MLFQSYNRLRKLKFEADLKFDFFGPIPKLSQNLEKLIWACLKDQEKIPEFVKEMDKQIEFWKIN